MADYELNIGDTYPPIEATLTDSNGPIDLTSATTVEFYMKGQVTNDIVHGVAAIITPASGVVRYTFILADTSAADTYRVHWKITWNSGGIQRVPNAASARKTVLIDANDEV